jgi:hypothetical protein
MNINEIQHRDEVLRAYFQGRDWDKNEEYLLKRKLILDSDQLLPEYQYVIEDEWEVESGRADQGCGDLVFTDGSGHFAVVEVKWIDLKSSDTASNKRTKKRKAVKEQAIIYAEIYEQKLSSINPSTVKKIEAYVYTNEDKKPQIQGR